MQSIVVLLEIFQIRRRHPVVRHGLLNAACAPYGLANCGRTNGPDRTSNGDILDLLFPATRRGPILAAYNDYACLSWNIIFASKCLCTFLGRTERAPRGSHQFVSGTRQRQQGQTMRVAQELFCFVLFSTRSIRRTGNVGRLDHCAWILRLHQFFCLREGLQMSVVGLDWRRIP